MGSQLVVVTSLPAGVARPGVVRASLHFSPRLTSTTARLDEFPEWMDWPATLRTITSWAVRPGFFSSASTATIVSPAARSNLWKALFRANTPVRSWQRPVLSDRNWRSYPTRTIADYVRASWAYTTFLDQEEPPSFERWANAYSPISALLVNVNQYEGDDPYEVERENMEWNWFRPGDGPPLGFVPSDSNDSTDPFKALVQWERFVDRRWGQDPDSAPPVPVPDLDFHQMVSALGDHPALQRLLGLVVDVELPDPGGVPFAAGLQAVLTGGPTGVRALRSQFSYPSFLPLSGVNEVVEGHLRADDASRFGVAEMDVDGSAAKLLQFSRNIIRRSYHGDLSTDSALSLALPALRANGLAVYWTQRAGRSSFFADVLDNLENALSANPDGILLTSETVTRGYRVDVYDEDANVWRRLGARVAGSTGGYLFTRTNALVAVPDGDEGWVEPTTTSDPTGNETDLYQGEEIVRWTGWSLAGPRPFRYHGTGLDMTPTDDQGNPTLPGLALRATYGPAPATLPRLRFGRTYRFRLRAVDLAGNSVPFSPAPTPASFTYATAPVTYRRLEPITSPLLAYRRPRSPGEGLERLVIRSNFDIADTDPSLRTCERHVAPPTTTVEQAEHHGVLDAGAGPDPSRYATLVARDGKSLTTGGTPDPDNEGIPYLGAAQITVPYLPDPLARGAALAGLPGGPGVVKVPFADGLAWPQSRAFRLVLKAGTGAPILPSAGNGWALTVFLPKAAQKSVRLSSYINGPDTDLLGIFAWLAEITDPAPLRAAAAAGRAWSITPGRLLELVHAVRQPLVAPELASLAVTKAAVGQTWGDVVGRATLDRPSTGRLELLARWDEPVDPPADPAPGRVQGRASVFVREVPEGSPLGSFDLAGRHELGDTKHRLIAYSLVATSRFVEHFGERAITVLSGTTPAVVSPPGFVSGTPTVWSPDRSTRYREGVDVTLDEAAGSVRRVAGGAVPNGASVRVEFVAPPVTRTSLEVVTPPETSQGVERNILSSARPALPAVRAVVPTFDWTGATYPPATLVSQRRGNGLRIWLDRPWWSSGDGELLGVVLRGAATPATPDRLSLLVSAWGRDPIFKGNVVPAALGATAFPQAVAVRSGLTVDEAPGAVTVAGHPVVFDPARRLWYCDLTVVPPAGAYAPFVRLALCRYQPDSLPDCHLSRVVLTDVVTLPADRTASVLYDPLDGRAVDVSVSGPTYRTPDTGHAPATVQVQVQVRRSGTTGHLGWVDDGTPVTLARTAYVQGVATWAGSVTLPDERGFRPMRLVLTEREQHLADAGVPTERIVYLDTIEV